MALMSEIRDKYPQYEDLTDKELADGFHNKFYSDIPIDDFYRQVGVDTYADERTLGGSVVEFAKSIPREFAGAFLSAGEGVAELSDAGANYLGFDDLIDSGDDNELVRLSREGRKSLDASFLGGDVAYQDQWSTKLGGALGSFASFLTPTGALKLAGVAGKGFKTKQTIAGLGLGGFGKSGESAQRVRSAREQGIEVSEEQEDAAVVLDFFNGLTEMAPVNRVLSKISKFASKKQVTDIKSLILSGLGSGAFEGFQELGSQIASNAIERGIYNENLAVDDSLYNAFTSDEFTLGASVGFLADVVLSSAAIRRRGIVTKAEEDREGELRVKRDERVALGEEAVSKFQAEEAQGAEQRAQEEQGLDFQPSQATVDPSQIDPPTPEQITKKLRRAGRYLQVTDATDPNNVETYQAEEKVRRRNVKGKIVETRYVVDINADGTTQEKIISKDGVPNPAISAQELAPPSEKFQPQSKPNPPKDYANHIYRVLGKSFPTAGSFQVDMLPSAKKSLELQNARRQNQGESDLRRLSAEIESLKASELASGEQSLGANQVVHITPNGNKTPFGRDVQSFEEASLIAGRLNEKIIDSQVNNSVTQVINNSTESYSPEVKSTLVTYGDTILHPDESTYTASAIDSAAGTTAPQFQENASAKDLIMQGVSKRKMTASQKLNAKRIAKGLPETNTFTPAEAKSVLKDKFSRLIRPPETLENAIYKAVARKNKKKKDEFVLVSGNGDTITERPPTKAEALAQLDKVGGRRRNIKFKNIGEARAYAKQVNEKEKIFVHSDSVLEKGDKDARLSVVADALKKNNITNDVGSPEIRALAENFTGVKATGNRRISDMNQGELKALVSGIRSLPRFDVPTKIPLFKHNRYTSDQFGAALEFVKQNDNDTTNLEGIAQAIGLDFRLDPQALKIAEVLAKDLKVHLEPIKNMPKLDPVDAIPQGQGLVVYQEPKVNLNKLTAILRQRMNSQGLSDVGLSVNHSLRYVSRNKENQLVFGVRQAQQLDKNNERMFDSDGKPLMGAKRNDENLNSPEKIKERNGYVMEGFYSPDINAVFLAVDAVRGSKDMSPAQLESAFIEILDHEIIHGMRQLDLWTESEWRLLSSQASKRKNRQGVTFLDAAKKAYYDKSPVVQMEEAIVEMVRESKLDPKIITGKPRTLLKRISDFFTKLVSSINGFGYNSFESIIQDIQSGVIGVRERGPVRTLLETERATETPSFNSQSQARPIVAQRDEREAVPVQDGQRKGDFEGVDATISEADTQAQSDFVESDILESRTIPDSDVPASSVLQFAPYSPAVDSASTYAQDFGLEYFPPDRHVLANPERGAEIAEEYEIMEHNPNDPLVASAYQALVDETLSQYEYLLRTGLKVEMMGEQDPYGGLPSNLIKDIKRNNHLYVFPTSQGYGPEGQDFSDLIVSEYPLLATTKFTDVNGVPMLANDVFRAVHDFYGHVKSGTTFRATGEENAWQNHAAMYSPLARRAMTTETRGQNSWVNFGPSGKSNKGAKIEDTVFAEQKTGLMPVWTSEENRVSANARQRRFEENIRNASSGLAGAVKDNGRIDLVHYATSEFQRSDPSKWGDGLSRNTRAERNRIESGGIGRTYFGVESNVPNRYGKEWGLGNFKYTAEVDASLLYDYNADPEGFYKGTQLQQNRDYNSYERKIRDSEYIGYFVNDPQLGTTVAVFDPLVVETQKISSKEKAKDSLSEGFVPKSTIPEISEEAINKVVEKNVEQEEASTSGFIPKYSSKAEPRAQYVAQNPEKGAKLSTEDNNMYSRANEPEYSSETQKEIDKLVTKSPDQIPNTTYLEVTNTGSIGEFFTKAKAAMINKWARLEAIYKLPQFKDLFADVGAIQAAMMADKHKAVTSSALTQGSVVYKNGHAQVEDFVFEGKKYRGLIEVVHALHADGNQYNVNLEQLAQAYMIAKRSVEQRKRGLKTPADENSLAVLEAEVNKYVDENGNSIIKEFAKRWDSYNRNTVQFLQDTGVLDAETSELWLKDSDYVPFYRQVDDPDTADNIPRIFSGMTSASTFKKLKGSESAVTVPLLEAIVRNLDAAVAMGMRNVAQQRIVRDLNSLGLAREVKAGEKGTNVINFKVDGKKRSFSIDDPLMFQAMESSSISSAESIITSVVGAPATALRELITRDPGFMIVNLMRDTLSTAVTSGASIIPVIDTVKNFNKSSVEELSRYGVVGGYDLSNLDYKNVFEKFKKESKKMGLSGASSKNIVKRMWDYLGEGTTKSDAATRKAVFDDVLKRTGNSAEAAWQASEIINFGRRGNNSAVRIVTAAIPFLNARFQGLDVFWRAAQGNYSAVKGVAQKRQAINFLMRGAFLAGLTALYWQQFSDDEQYKEASEHTRDNYWLIPTAWGVPFKVPIPFEVGLIFKVIPERILGVGSEKTTGKEAYESLKRGVTGTLGINPLGAQIIKPMFEVMYNKNTFTGAPVVPPYMVDDKLEGFAAGRITTSEFAKWVGTNTNTNPLKIEHIIKGYTGTIGSYVLGAVDAVMRTPALTGDKSLEMPSRPIFEYPLMKRFFNTAHNSGAKEDFYELNSEIKKTANTLGKLAEDGRMAEYEKYLKGREILLGMSSQARYIEKQLKLIRNHKDNILKSELSPSQKEEIIDDLELAEKEILKESSMLRSLVDQPFIDTLYR